MSAFRSASEPCYNRISSSSDDGLGPSEFERESLPARLINYSPTALIVLCFVCAPVLITCSFTYALVFDMGALGYIPALSIHGATLSLLGFLLWRTSRAIKLIQVNWLRAICLCAFVNFQASCLLAAVVALLFSANPDVPFLRRLIVIPAWILAIYVSWSLYDWCRQCRYERSAIPQNEERYGRTVFASIPMFKLCGHYVLIIDEQKYELRIDRNTGNRPFYSSRLLQPGEGQRIRNTFGYHFSIVGWTRRNHDAIDAIFKRSFREFGEYDRVRNNCRHFLLSGLMYIVHTLHRSEPLSYPTLWFVMFNMAALVWRGVGRDFARLLFQSCLGSGWEGRSPSVFLDLGESGSYNPPGRAAVLEFCSPHGMPGPSFSDALTTTPDGMGTSSPSFQRIESGTIEVTDYQGGMQTAMTCFDKSTELYVNSFGGPSPGTSYDTLCIVYSDVLHVLKKHPFFEIKLNLPRPGHRFPPSVLPFRIESLEARGRGLLATRDIQPGSLIVRERPMLVMTGTPLDGLSENLHDHIDRLNPRMQKAFYDLSNCKSRGSGINEELSIVRTNGIRLTFPFEAETHVGVFALASRANHSCTPNATFAFDYSIFAGELVCLRPIPVNTEITISYICELQPAAQRVAALRQQYNFVCGCAGCVPSSPTYAVSEERRETIFQLLPHSQTSAAMIQAGGCDEYHVQRTLDLLDAEQLSFYRPLALARFAQLEETVGHEDTARALASRAMEELKRFARKETSNLWEGLERILKLESSPSRDLLPSVSTDVNWNPKWNRYVVLPSWLASGVLFEHWPTHGVGNAEFQQLSAPRDTLCRFCFTAKEDEPHRLFLCPNPELERCRQRYPMVVPPERLPASHSEAILLIRNLLADASIHPFVGRFACEIGDIYETAPPYESNDPLAPSLARVSTAPCTT